MTPDQLDQVFLLGKYLIASIPATIAVVTAISKFFDHLNVKITERSVGETKVRILQNAINSLTERFKLIEEKVDNQSFRIAELHTDNRELKHGNTELIKTLMEFMKK